MGSTICVQPVSPLEGGETDDPKARLGRWRVVSRTGSLGGFLLSGLLALIMQFSTSGGECFSPDFPVRTADGECIPQGAKYCGSGHFCPAASCRFRAWSIATGETAVVTANVRSKIAKASAAMVSLPSGAMSSSSIEKW